MTDAINICRRNAKRERFKAALHAVVKHYECANDEVKEMLECARRDPEAALTCFEAIAHEIDPAAGINERIREDIETGRKVDAATARA